MSGDIVVVVKRGDVIFETLRFAPPKTAGTVKQVLAEVNTEFKGALRQADSPERVFVADDCLQAGRYTLDITRYTLDITAGPPPPPPVVEELCSVFGHLYNHSYGQEVAKALRRRISPVTDAQLYNYELGACFPLMGYNAPAVQLLKVLEGMVAHHRTFCNSQEFGPALDMYKRQVHICQLAAAPGMGKTTAGINLWVLIYLLCADPPITTPISQELRDMVERSLSPDRFLVLPLNFAEGDTIDLDSLEKRMVANSGGRYHGVLALRLLYSALGSSKGSYSAFLATISETLSSRIQPWDVINFIRQCAGIMPGQECLIVWSLDEINAPQERFMQALLSTCVQVRLAARYDNHKDTIFVPIVASTIWSRSSLFNTVSSQAKKVDIQLLPLTLGQKYAIISDLAIRLSQAPQPVVHRSLGWPPFDMRTSSELPPASFTDVVQSVMELVGGNPRILAYALCIVTTGDSHTFRLAQLAHRIVTPVFELQHVTKHLISAVQTDGRWQKFAADSIQPGVTHSKEQLLWMLFSYTIVQEPVRHNGYVPGVPLSVKWEELENDGLLSLLSEAGVCHRLSAGGMEIDVPDSIDFYVFVSPLLLAAFGLRMHKGCVYLEALYPMMNWRAREWQDLGTLYLRLCLARDYLSMEEMPAQQVLCGGASPAAARAPRWTVFTPTRFCPIQHLKAKPTKADMDKYITAYIADDAMPWAFLGTHNYRYDSFMILKLNKRRQASHSAAPVLIVYISSKQRLGQEAVTADDIYKQRDKDIIDGVGYPYVYLYVTDQSFTGVITDPQIIVMHSQLHEAFYGSMAALVRCSKA